MVQKEVSEKSSNAPPKQAGWFGVRHEQYILLFTAILISYGIRTTFNLAIIAMISNEPPTDDIPTYPEWTDKKNIMLSSFFWGYVCFQIGAGELAKNYGPKLFLGTAIFICSLATILLPLMGEKFGYGGVIACRVVQGMTQGFLYPSVHNLLSAWVPIANRAVIGSFVYAAAPLGNVLAMPLTGSISASTIGWPMTFYLYGGLGMTWSIFWIIFGSDNPSKHKRISLEERRYIEDGASTEEKEVVPTPWLSIATSLPFFAILIAHCGQNWGFWTLLMEIPSYMENILKFKIASNSYLSALPYLVLWLISFVMSPIADRLILKQVVSRGTSRKIFNSIGFMVPAVALLALNFVGSSQKEVTIVILVIAVGFNAGVLSGYNVNHMDISPIHSGTLMGIANSLSNIFSVIAPLTVDAVKSITGYEETDKSMWNIVFSIAAIIYVLTGTFYAFFASGEVQPWDNLELSEKSSAGLSKKQLEKKYESV
ncbi:putative inorganic phosphate cotransporter [Anoplophora glabripennis]|uniref:putative inorganic phosphate cotransporter n=1 Tax=Anoplophora glabripennis TaxID=217634 RepID=UPI00087469B7|nr:putative inorganic phosphate cotransporter [Anoplophora glabripennis]